MVNTAVARSRSCFLPARATLPCVESWPVLSMTHLQLTGVTSLDSVPQLPAHQRVTKRTPPHTKVAGCVTSYEIRAAPCHKKVGRFDFTVKFTGAISHSHRNAPEKNTANPTKTIAISQPSQFLATLGSRTALGGFWGS